MGKNTFKTSVKDNQVTVPLSLFDSQPFQVISPEKFQYEIAVEKKPDNTYAALLLKCTHYQNQLTVTGKFDKAGNVIRGSEELSLEKLDTRIIKNNLLIHL